jgi:hypothetical protein
MQRTIMELIIGVVIAFGIFAVALSAIEVGIVGY